MTASKRRKGSALRFAECLKKERCTVVVYSLALEYLGFHSLAHVDFVLVADERVSKVREHAHDHARVALRAKEEIEGVLEQRRVELMVRRSKVDIGELGVLRSGKERGSRGAQPGVHAVKEADSDNSQPRRLHFRPSQLDLPSPSPPPSSPSPSAHRPAPPASTASSRRGCSSQSLESWSPCPCLCPCPAAPFLNSTTWTSDVASSGW